MRLQQYLARSGITSRRKAEDLIQAGRVTINDKVAEVGAVVGENDVVRLDGEKVRMPQKTIVIALNKPKGYTTTHEDNHADKLVYELVPMSPGLHSVGRLDKDTEGLLLLTNDGHLTQLLSHPRNAVRKLYRVWSKKGRLSEAECQQLIDGVILGDGPAKALEAIPSKEGALLTMAEGRKREVRRMLGRVGHPVEKLVRLAVGPIELADLEPGNWRYLEAHEIELLRQNAQPPKLRKAKPANPPLRGSSVKPSARNTPPKPLNKEDLSEATRAKIDQTIAQLGGPDDESAGRLRAYDQERTPNPKRERAARGSKPMGKAARGTDKGKRRASKPTSEATQKPKPDSSKPETRASKPTKDAAKPARAFDKEQPRKDFKKVPGKPSKPHSSQKPRNQSRKPKAR